MFKTRCYQEGVGQLEPRFQVEGVVPGELFLVSLSDSANCTVLRAVVFTQYRRVTDGQTDGRTDRIAVASTALAMRALRRAVKMRVVLHQAWSELYCWDMLLSQANVRC